MALHMHVAEVRISICSTFEVCNPLKPSNTFHRFFFLEVDVLQFQGCQPAIGYSVLQLMGFTIANKATSMGCSLKLGHVARPRLVLATWIGEPPPWSVNPSQFVSVDLKL